MRLSIEISKEQHQKLKAAAALSGQSIKDYVLQRTLPGIENIETLKQQISCASEAEVPERVPHQNATPTAAAQATKPPSPYNDIFNKV